MGALLSLPQDLLNLLLPFTSKSTPLAQDLIHTVLLCGTLYFAPQLVELYHARNTTPPLNHDALQNDTPREDDLPIDENLGLQPDVLQPDEEDDLERPPLAPTPPPGQALGDNNNGNGINDAGPANWQQNVDARAWNEQDGNVEAGPGFADNERPRPTPQNRVIGAKKAKSLARKDQRRAYHEFHRQEAEMRRLQEAQGKEEREAALAAEKARRAEVERAIQERIREEREAKKEIERAEHEEERLRRESVLKDVRGLLEKKGAVNLQDVAWKEGKDILWVERLVRASGLLAKMSKDGVYTMITSAGWAVQVDSQLMREAYARAVEFGNAQGGKVSFDGFGDILEEAVRVRAE